MKPGAPDVTIDAGDLAEVEARLAGLYEGEGAGNPVGNDGPVRPPMRASGLWAWHLLMRPAKGVLGGRAGLQDFDACPALHWMVPSTGDLAATSPAVLGAMVDAIEHDKLVALQAVTPERLKAAAALLMSLLGGAHA